MLEIREYISGFNSFFPQIENLYPWELTSNLREIISKIIPKLSDLEYTVKNGVAIHKSTVIEKGVTIKKPFIAMENCHISANAYFREGVFLGNDVEIGPSTEIKRSIICSGTKIAHLNYIGDSIIGQNVNFEAGSVAANHYNEKQNQNILVKIENDLINTGVKKFGALIGDGSKIGANSVLSPGTLLQKESIVERLQLIKQANY
ncbi:LpxA family transferase [Tamlana fucoidanivorans]|uniref:LpxA family transferase n=1 Tax=Allotamlana fucoidanivorans TaxID=2583814 RepID=A0A5C4SP88_9FLAO|nr:LpxA family transferase [Tamlana fucoidanivorans]TNJ46031.1 LpxA family transferase [Tamlana fucoidanivorans]